MAKKGAGADMGGAISPQLKNAISTTERFMTSHRGKVGRALTPRLAELQRDMFANERDVYDKPFAPLAASTLVRKARTPGGPLILSRTFELGTSSYVLFTGNRPVWHIGDSGRWAQEGDTGRGNRPRRRLWPEGVTPKTWTNAMKLAEAEVSQKTKI